MLSEKFKKYLKISFIIMILVIILAIVLFKTIRYKIKGEENLPFYFEQLTIISSANGKLNADNNSANIFQLNDLYFQIKKNKENTYIKSIEFLNFKEIKDEKILGKLEVRTIKQDENGINILEENINLSNIKFSGDVKTNLNTNTIANQGGTIGVRIIISDLGEIQLENNQIEQNGKLLNKLNVKTENIKRKINFDIILELENDIKYKANITVDIPIDNMEIEGVSNKSLELEKNIIFKRIKNNR